MVLNSDFNVSMCVYKPRLAVLCIFMSEMLRPKMVIWGMKEAEHLEIFLCCRAHTTIIWRQDSYKFLGLSKFLVSASFGL